MKKTKSGKPRRPNPLKQKRSAAAGKNRKLDEMLATDPHALRAVGFLALALAECAAGNEEAQNSFLGRAILAAAQNASPHPPKKYETKEGPKK